MMTGGLEFDWDRANAEHIARHNVTPEEVEQMFWNDPLDLSFELVDGEERWTAIGHTNLLRVVIVVHTMRRGAIRPITAREAGKRLRREYLQLKAM